MPGKIGTLLRIFGIAAAPNFGSIFMHRNRNLLIRLRNRCRRETSAILFRRNFHVQSPVPLISFTFDDFPRSAYRNAGAILKRYDLRATYYASLGLMSRAEPTGEMFELEDLRNLLVDGHELGCHTFGHHEGWATSPAVFEASVLENRVALQQYFPEASFQSLAYPISQPRPATKRRMSHYFSCCRGGGQTFNVGNSDLNSLSAFFLEKSASNPDQVRVIIERNRDQHGWLIFATHDVRASPSPWGCTPEFFENVIRWSLASGAVILPVAEVIKSLR